MCAFGCTEALHASTGEKLYYAGANLTTATGDKLRCGQQGEVVRRSSGRHVRG
jgi:hypothetical protein